MLLGFGTAAKQVPNILPGGRVSVFDVVIPTNRFWLTGIVDRA